MLRMKKGFTLIELLVVIAIIAILAAILFPVFAQAREKARGATCLSNQKQIALSVAMYVQDYDEHFPQSQYGGGNTGVTQMSWAALLWPYVKNGDHNADGTAWAASGIYTCPSAKDPRQNFQLGVHLDIFADDWNGGTTPTCALTAIDTPSDKIILMDKGRTDSTSWAWIYFTSWEWDWVSSVGGNRPTKDGNDIEEKFDCDGLTSVGQAWAGCGMHPRYRHNRTCNVAFADGHVKGMVKGQIKWYKNIYVSTGAAANWTGQGWYPY